jgi:hypothetical protein
VLAAAKI